MKAKIVGIITARMNSTRLPGKVMKELSGKSVFAHHVERLRSVKGLSAIYLGTSSEKDANRPLINDAQRLGVSFYEGANEDVLERHERIIAMTGAGAVVRITCDMPLFDIETINQYIDAFNIHRSDYIYPGNFNLLSGTMCELISSDAIRRSHKEYKGPAITKYILEHPDEFKIYGVQIRNDICRTDIRLDLDYPEDLELMRIIYNELYKGKPILLEDVYRFLDDNPSLIQINRWRTHKDVVSYGQSLLYKPVFQITRCGDDFIILNENSQQVKYEDFLKELKKIFKKVDRRIK